MSKATWLLVVVLSIGSFGCATNYQQMGFTGGYADVRLDKNTFRVEFRGNGYTSRQTVETYLLFRCAELTKAAGFDYFVIANSDTEAQRGAYTTPSTYRSTTTGSATVAGNTAFASARTVGSYTPGSTFIWNKYNATARFKTFNGTKPEENPNAYDASEVLQYLGPRVVRDDGQKMSTQLDMGKTKSEPDTEANQVALKAPQSEIKGSENKPSQQALPVAGPSSKSPNPVASLAPTTAQPQNATASAPLAPANRSGIKALAQLFLVKGPIVTNPPQAFSAEFQEDGKASAVLSGRRLVTGNYELFGIEDSIKAKYSPQLIHAETLKTSRGADAKGFAALSDGSGTDMECAYTLNRSTSRGEGICVDNQRNTYSLIFD